MRLEPSAPIRASLAIGMLLAASTVLADATAIPSAATADAGKPARGSDAQAARSVLKGPQDPNGIIPLPNIELAWANQAGSAFHPTRSGLGYQTGPDDFLYAGALMTFNGASREFEAQLDLPHEAMLNYFDVFGYQAHPTQNLQVRLIERCVSPADPGNPVENVLASIVVGNVGGDFFRDASLVGSVDAENCTYHARATFGSGPDAPSYSMQLSKVRVEYWVSY